MTDRLTIEPDGTFNELVVHGALVHLERLDDGLLWLHVVAANGEEYRMDIHSEKAIGVLMLQQPAASTSADVYQRRRAVLRHYGIDDADIPDALRELYAVDKR